MADLYINVSFFFAREITKRCYLNNCIFQSKYILNERKDAILFLKGVFLIL